MNPTVYNLKHYTVYSDTSFPIGQITGLFSFVCFKMDYNTMYLLIPIEVKLHVPNSDFKF